MRSNRRSPKSTMVDIRKGRNRKKVTTIAVTNAEITLQTVVSIRDRVIQAYQEILRMPI